LGEKAGSKCRYSETDHSGTATIGPAGAGVSLHALKALGYEADSDDEFLQDLWRTPARSAVADIEQIESRRPKQQGYEKAYRAKKRAERAEQQRVADGLEAARVVDDPEVAMGAMASVPDAVMRPGVAADAIVAAPDEAFPWWRHPCPPEILSQGKGSRAYQNWWMKRYRAKRKAEFLRAVKHRESHLRSQRKYLAKKRAEQQRVADGLEAARVGDVVRGAKSPDKIRESGST